MAKNRPQTFKDFIGDSNKKAVEKLKIVVGASKRKAQCPPHILLFGNPGCGKTTLSNIVANELGYELRTVTGGTLKSQSNILDVLYDVNKAQLDDKNMVLFLDECHKIGSTEMPEEMWFPLLEDFHFYHNLKGKTLVFDEDEYKMTNNFSKTNPFLIIGATTNPGDLSKALRDRFQVHCFLHEYTESDLSQIVMNYCDKENIKINKDACLAIANRGRNNPRETLNLLTILTNKIVLDDVDNLEKDYVNNFLDFLDIDEHGLTNNDIKALEVLSNHEKGMGIENLSGTSGIEKSILKEMVLPFLQYRGLSKTTHRRLITEKGLKYLERKVKDEN